MERIRGGLEKLGLGGGQKQTDAKGNRMSQEWIYEYNFGSDQQPKGPYTITKLEIKSDSFSGEGREDQMLKFKFYGVITGKKFTID